MKNLKTLTKLKSKHCFTIDPNGLQTPEYVDLHIRVLNEDGTTKYYQISRASYGTRNHMITTYIKYPDSTFYYGNDVSRRCKLYNDEEFEKKLDKLAKELSKQNIIFQNIVEEDLLEEQNN
jgi:hypothetical protein